MLRCPLTHSDKRCLIRKLVLYGFKLSHNDREAKKQKTKTSFIKNELADIYSTVIIWWLYQFCLLARTLAIRQRQVGLNRWFRCHVQKVIEVISTITPRRVSGESNMIHHINDLGKDIKTCRIMSHVTKILKNIWVSFVYMREWSKKYIDLKVHMIMSYILLSAFSQWDKNTATPIEKCLNWK